MLRNNREEELSGQVWKNGYRESLNAGLLRLEGRNRQDCKARLAHCLSGQMRMSGNV